MDIINILCTEFGIGKNQAQNTVDLLEEGNTVPFIARYRKEMTGSLDDQIIRNLADRLEYLKSLLEKKKQVSNTILEQEKMTPEIEKALEKATTLSEVEDIYLPFRPKRRTRATIAKEKGLEPLANWIIKQEDTTPLPEKAKEFLTEEVTTPEEAITYAKDILAEVFAEDSNCRSTLRKLMEKEGLMVTKATNPEEPSVYEMYYDYSEPIQSIAHHRVLAITRGEKEGFLTAKIQLDQDITLEKLKPLFIRKNSPHAELLLDVLTDSYKRLLFPSIEREINGQKKDDAQEQAIQIFGENLKQLLLLSPLPNRVVMALDPGYRMGCKVAVVDETGKPLDTAVIYPTPPQNKIAEAKEVLKKLMSKHQVSVVAIGNGTASGETEVFFSELLEEIPDKISYLMVNEAGASVYSASALGAQEFPQYDVSVRSAISIARRLQDPLAELVKIDPKSLGIGQYQHDMNQKRLSATLAGIVEYCVNLVGVDLNRASPSLLSYVAGISPAIAKNILTYREEIGRFSKRSQLLKVPKLGKKAYEQCAGFLRIRDGEQVLDQTAVHPESYGAAEKLLELLSIPVTELTAKENKSRIQKTVESNFSWEEIAEKLAIGVPTLKDIVTELQKPGRDPREDMTKPLLKNRALHMEDLKEGMVLPGTVRNITDFGAFVDIGVHQDGLVHISHLSDSYVRHPLDVVKLGDVVQVKVLSVDLEKKRISLSRKGID